MTAKTAICDSTDELARTSSGQEPDERGLRSPEHAVGAERAYVRLQLLERVGSNLAAALDAETALKRLAAQIVPQLADCCITYTYDGAGIRAVGFAHTDPEKQPLVEALAATASPAVTDTTGVGAVIGSGEDALSADLMSEHLEQNRHDEPRLELVRALEAGSAMIVALRARGTTVGAIALVTTAESGRRYDSKDLELARELAGRAALHVDNARRLEEASANVRARDDFITAILHDVRNPLQSISTAASLLRFDPSPELTSRSIDTIELAASQVDRLLSDLLDLSRIDAGQLSIESEVIDMASLLTNAETLFRPLARAKSVTFDCATVPDSMLVRADRERMLQVLSNLLGNALKFVSSGGRITLSASHSKDAVEIAVTDDGMGIKESDLKHVFDRFWRGGHQRPGTGLGLALAKAIVEAHGGSIGMTSREGKGSTVTLRLAAEPRQAPARAERPPSGPQAEPFQ